jgi:hypothetical protein
MNSKGLTAAAVILIALAGGLYWSNHHQPAEPVSTSATPSEPATTILTVNKDDLTRVEIKKKGADPIVLVKDNDSWRITAPKQLAVDQEAIATLTSAASTLTAQRVVEEKANDLGQYGLTEPDLEVDLTSKDGAVHKLLFGDDTPTGGAVYARLDNDPRVVTLASITKTNFNKDLVDVRDKRLLTLEADKLTRLELKTKSQDIEFDHDNNQWQILKPSAVRADQTEIDTLVRNVVDARMSADSLNDPKMNDAGFAAGTLVASVKATAPSGTQTLEVRTNKNDYFAKSSAVEGAYTVPSDLATALDKKLDDFRNKKLFDLANDPGKIEIHDGSNSYVLTKSGSDWQSTDGKKWEPASVTTLLDKLRNLQATKFADSGSTTSVIDFTITSTDGKQTERVLISKTATGYIAKRENETGLYVLESNAVEDLQKSAGELKQAS